MGFPFKPHPRENTVLSKHFGEAEARTLDGWKKRGGYRALEQALGMDPLAIQAVVKDSGLRRQAALPLLQRRRIRARHVQGS